MQTKPKYRLLKVVPASVKYVIYRIELMRKFREKGIEARVVPMRHDHEVKGRMKEVGMLRIEVDAEQWQRAKKIERKEDDDGDLPAK